MILNQLRPEFAGVDRVWLNQLNPFFMAGWVGLLITGLNMLPVSQLDGGHVVYTLFRHRAHWVARCFLLIAITYVVYADAFIWAPMVVLVTLIGTDHPPTANDTLPLGWFRTALGLASLAIPVLCFPPRGVFQFGFS
jgi:membrane-associated protease RseP (regulator of RpoE activity)